MYCPKCGKKFNQNVKFCSNCGYRIVKSDEQENTKEINISVLKNVEQNPNYDFKRKKKKVDGTSNAIIFIGGIIIILILVVIILLILNNRHNYLFSEEKNVYCQNNYDSDICIEKEKKNKEFDSLDFSSYDFNESTSKQAFYNKVIDILREKNEEGNLYCNNINYNNLTNSLNQNLDLDYSYLCGININYLNNLISRLNNFYKINRLDKKIIDSFIVKSDDSNDYVSYGIDTIGYNNYYLASLRRIYMNVNAFKDYDKIKKSYTRDLINNYHVKNSKVEDLIIHESAHAIDFYILAKRYNIDGMVIEDTSNYAKFIDDWNNQKYAKEVVKKAIDKINSNNQIKRNEEDLFKEISNNAYLVKNGKVMYDETFAEALVDYFNNGINASLLSIEIYNIVQEDLNSL